MMMKRRSTIGKLQQSKICVLIKSSFFSGKTNNITAKNNRKQIVTNRLIGTKIIMRKKANSLCKTSFNTQQRTPRTQLIFT
ncbi:hypothetical protein SAMN05660477_02960 [Soonwooa buanensis]|uniref:Uncharacterized protein n=1 Tax=Soonwooa buanensis TaxID=619805 RepID=A0A1T5GLQ9_9FLAO|nr:hypothetical protein SAMN05660477_02960 [Soonwooa buanensis]